HLSLLARRELVLTVERPTSLIIQILLRLGNIGKPDCYDLSPSRRLPGPGWRRLAPDSRPPSPDCQCARPFCKMNLRATTRACTLAEAQTPGAGGACRFKATAGSGNRP